MALGPVVKAQRIAEREWATGRACPYCSCTMGFDRGLQSTPTRDHIIPSSRGGSNNPSNILITCFKCNNDKANLTLEEFHERLVCWGDWRSSVVSALIKSAPQDLLVKPKKTDTVCVASMFDSVPESIRKWMRSTKGEFLSRHWIATRVMEKLNIAPECWALSPKGKTVLVSVASAETEFKVSSTDQLEEDIISALGVPAWHTQPQSMQTAA